MKKISVETLLKTIRDNYVKYVDEGFDVPEVQIEHGNGSIKLLINDEADEFNSLLLINKDEFGVEFMGRTDVRGEIFNYNMVTTPDEIAEIVDGLFQFFVGFNYTQFSNLNDNYYTEFHSETGPMFGNYEDTVFDI